MIQKPTDSELEILQILWKKGPSTVREVNDLLNEKREVGYTTTLKLMQIMAEKGLASRNKEGKTHIYKAEANQDDTRQALVERLMETAFGGSALQLALQALGNTQSNPEELQQLREYLDQLEGDQS